MSTSVARPYTLEMITRSVELEGIVPDWEALWRRCPSATPFQSPYWLLPWWRHLGEGELHTLALREGGRLRALVPMHIAEGQDGLRRVMLLGTGISDVLDALAEPGMESAVTDCFLSFLGQEHHRWDHVELHQLPPGSALLGGEARGLVDEVTHQDPCPVLDLPARIEDLPHHVPAAMLKNLRYYERRARAAGANSFDQVTLDSLDGFLSSFFGLHAARWQAAGLPGVLAAERIARFHRDAAERLLMAGVLRGYMLRRDGRVIGVYYGLLHGGRAYDYLCGFDPAEAGLSPGALLVHHAIGEAIREGAREFDFLRGREDYKYRWGAGDRPCFRRHMRQRC